VRLNAIAFFIGTCLLILCRNLPAKISISTVIILFFPLLFANIKNRFSFIFRALFVVLLGFIWAWQQAHWRLEHKLAIAIEDKTLMAEGYIASIPEPQIDGVRFEFFITQLKQDAQLWPSPGRVRLTWMNSPFSLNVGDKWQLQVRLKQPHGTMNPGGFDYEAWLFEHNIRATGYVRPSIDNHLLNSRWFHYPLDRLRQAIATHITQCLKQSNFTGFITALTVGVRDAVTPQQWQILRGTGTNHLIAIAGLHIGFVAGISFFLVNFIWRRLGNLILYIPAQQAAACAALIAAIFYSALAGFALPTQRAVIMIAVYLCSVLLRRNLPAWQALLLALLIILVVDPLAPLSSSFWLSFIAVAFIIYGINGRKNSLLGWRQWLRMQWIIAMGLIPLLLLFFQQVSLAGFIANMLAIPYVGFVVMPLSLLGVLGWLIIPSWSNSIFYLAGRAFALFWPVLQFIANITWLQWHTAIANGWLFLAAMIAVLLFLAPRGFPARWLGIFWFAPLMGWKPQTPPTNEVWFTLLDVGQGLATVIQTQHHLLVYDTGPKFNTDFDMGDSIVVPYLRSIGVAKVDMLVISHGDNDHIGGAQSVIAETQVQKIITSVPEKFAPGSAQPCLQGQSWQWDGVNFKFLYPPVRQINLDNDSSCVLQISVGKQSLLLTGDIEHKSEHYLLQNEAEFLPANIIIAPHHGSISSSTPDFIKAVMPQYVLFPVGYLNRYHFPNPAVVMRYQQIGAKNYDTATAGAIRFQFNGISSILPPACYRLSHRYFWNL